MCVCCVCIYVVVTLRFATTTYIDTHIHTYIQYMHTYVYKRSESYLDSPLGIIIIIEIVSSSVVVV